VKSKALCMKAPENKLNTVKEKSRGEPLWYRMESVVQKSCEKKENAVAGPPLLFLKSFPALMMAIMLVCVAQPPPPSTLPEACSTPLKEAIKVYFSRWSSMIVFSLGCPAHQSPPDRQPCETALAYALCAKLKME